MCQFGALAARSAQLCAKTGRYFDQANCLIQVEPILGGRLEDACADPSLLFVARATLDGSSAPDQLQIEKLVTLHVAIR